jgi:RNA polymerase sigma-70 factor, ECF subfamily
MVLYPSVMPLNLDALYRRYASMVHRRCLQLLRDTAEADDAMQETFVRIWQSRENLEEQYPSSLLYTTATHVSLNRLRTRRRHPEDRDSQLLHAIACGEEFEESIMANSFLNRLFHQEPPSTRVMAVLHYVDGLTLEEVAKECNLSVSGVRKRLRKIRETALSMQALEEAR